MTILLSPNGTEYTRKKISLPEDSSFVDMYDISFVEMTTSIYGWATVANDSTSNTSEDERDGAIEYIEVTPDIQKQMDEVFAAWDARIAS